MKKVYETPVAEKIEFCYRDQVVASGGNCRVFYTNEGIWQVTFACVQGDPEFAYSTN